MAGRIEVAGLSIDPEVVSHPLIGDAHAIVSGDLVVTHMSAIDWDRPARIPTVAEPGRLPRGSSLLVLNEIARRAKDAGISALRYAGPYPTRRLYEALLKCFHVEEVDDREFCDDVLQRALTLSTAEIPVDFAPAPFERVSTSYGFFDRRDGAIERMQIANIIFDCWTVAGSLAHLQETARGHAAVLSLTPSMVVARIAEIDREGTLLSGPEPIPSLAHLQLVGTRFAPELVDELAESFVEQIPEPLIPDAQRFLRERGVVWADLGWRTAAATPAGFALHVALSATIKVDVGLFALKATDWLADIVQRTVLEELIASLA
jgi:hypothetical protein